MTVIWYREAEIRYWLKREKPGLLAYTGWLTKHLQAAFTKGRQIGAGERSQLVDSLNDRIDRLQTERDVLRLIVDKFPKTADGVPVVPGMTLWFWNGLRLVELQHEYRTGQSYWGICEYTYSTREAAEQAKE